MGPLSSAAISYCFSQNASNAIHYTATAVLTPLPGSVCADSVKMQQAKRKETFVRKDKMGQIIGKIATRCAKSHVPVTHLCWLRCHILGHTENGLWRVECLSAIYCDAQWLKVPRDEPCSSGSLVSSLKFVQRTMNTDEAWKPGRAWYREKNCFETWILLHTYNRQLVRRRNCFKQFGSLVSGFQTTRVCWLKFSKCISGMEALVSYNCNFVSWY